MEGEEAKDPMAIVSGTLIVNHIFTRVLFDFGATYLFVNNEFIKKLTIKPDEKDTQLYVTTPLGSVCYTNIIFKNIAINVQGRVLSAALGQL